MARVGSLIGQYGSGTLDICQWLKAPRHVVLDGEVKKLLTGNQ
jgi:hypothetical protein